MESKGRTHKPITKFVSVVKIKSIKDTDLGRMWVALSMTWFKLYCTASSASLVPCRLVEFPFHHFKYLALKFPIYIAIVGEQSLMLMILSSHLCLNKENCSMRWLGEFHRHIYTWNWNMKSFSNEALNFLFRKFWASSVLDPAQTIWGLQILPQKSSLNFWMKEFWKPLENHLLMNMLLCTSHYSEVH